MEWFRQWFGALYEEIYVHRDPAEAQVQVDTLLRRTGVGPLPVLDAGCGAGRHLRILRDRLRALCPENIRLDELSMGMSGDFEVAIEEGTTIVRVGSALFEGVE